MEVNMIYTMTLNPSLDYIVDVENFTKGIVNRTTREMILPGGKGINVSIVLSNLGMESVAIGFTAGFTGDEIRRLVEEAGIPTDFIAAGKGLSRINVKLRSEPESEINGQGPKIEEDDINKLYAQLETLQEGDILVLAGSIPGSMPKSIYMDIMKFLEFKNVRVVVDATKDLLMDVLEYHPFLIKPNHHELGEIFDTVITVRCEAILYAKRLREKGAQNVLVSMAGDGAVLIAEDGSIFESDAPKGNVKYCVGAGDSMVAGFLAGYLKYNDYKEAFQMGICAGSASAFSENLATKEEVELVLKDYRAVLPL